MDETSEATVGAAVLQALHTRPGAARFVREICAQLGHTGVGAAEVERALARLEAVGAVVVRDHACPDPHLAGVDLRIVARAEPGTAATRVRALEAIERTWQEWLGTYLASHRCG